LCCKFFCTRQVLIYADDVNISGGRAHTIKKEAETLLVISKETGLVVDAGKTNYMVMFPECISHSINTDSAFFEMVEDFEYLGTILTNQNSNQEKLGAD
jgi:hypothetical protein